MDKPTNDNNAFHGDLLGPDPHGHAALLLVESLIHGLIARKAISVENAVEIVTIAMDTTEEISGDLENSSRTFQPSLTILRAISQSLSHDL